MKINVLGTGMVGLTLAQKLQELGHEVAVGTRNREASLARTEKIPRIDKSLKEWIESHHGVVLQSFADLSRDVDLFLNASNGMSALEVLRIVGAEKLEGKIIMDVANPLDFSNGMPPTLSVCNNDSLGEQIQNKYPKALVVKTLNTMSSDLMVNPGLVTSDHNVFVSGNDKNAKDVVAQVLREIGWSARNILDLGDITTARGTEMLLPIWLRLWGTIGTSNFNFHVVSN